MSFIDMRIEINEEEIRRQVNDKLDAAIRDVLLVWGINEMSKRTCMSKTFLEQEFLRDPRMRILERRKEKGKRYWFYEESLKAMKQIMDEW